MRKRIIITSTTESVGWGSWVYTTIDEACAWWLEKCAAKNIDCKIVKKENFVTDCVEMLVKGKQKQIQRLINEFIVEKGKKYNLKS